MSTKTYTKSLLLVALTLMASGGFLLHLRIHPPADHSYNFIPAVSGVLSIVVVPCLLSFKRTLSYGYVLNGMLAILGTIAMAHFSIAHWPSPAAIDDVALRTTLADILILWDKVLLGR